MQGVKQALLVIFVVAVIAFVARLSDTRQNRIPRSVKDRIRQTMKQIAQNAFVIHVNLNQNPVVSLLRLSGDQAVIENLRNTFSDVELNDITQVDVAALAEVIETEQHKAFQRVAYFLPRQLGHDAYLQFYWPQTLYTNTPHQQPPQPDASQTPQPEPDE